MADTSVKKFSLTYTNALTQERVTERPRVMITVDGKHKSLVVGDATILATRPIESHDADLWNAARARFASPAAAQ